MANIRRTNSRTLRDIAAREEMDSTSSLVQIYNETTDEVECQVLFDWLEQYLQVVCQSAPEVFSLNQLYEFGKLGELRRNDARTADIVCRTFCCLRKHIKPGESCPLSFVLALECFLSNVNATYLKQQATNVASLVQDLLVMTSPSHTLLNSTTYVVHISQLLALEKALMALRGIGGGIGGDIQGESSVDYFKKAVKERLKSIIRAPKYYPIAFQAYVIKKNIKMQFLNKLCSRLFDVGRSVFLFLGSGLHSCQGLKEIMEPKLDLDSILDEIRETRQAISEGVHIKDSSYCEISLAALEAMATDDFNIFVQCFENLGSWDIKWETLEKSLMIKYTLLMHMCLFFREDVSQTTQEQAMDLLQNLLLDERRSRWRSDPVLYDGFLDVIISIAVQYPNHYATCNVIFGQMHSCATEEQIKAITNFLGTQTFEEKVRGLQMSRNNEKDGSLFHIVKARAGITQSFSMCVRNRELLIENYKNDKCAMVPLIMGLHQEKHVKDFDFNLVMYDKVLVRNNNEDFLNQDDYNQVANNVQRTMQVKKSITIHEIFKKQDEIVGGPIDENRIVHVIGNPGTGKTSLSKRLCYDWANGNWGSMFTHVYLLRVRQLSRGIRGSQMDLIRAIVNLCYIADRRCGCEELIYEEVKGRLQRKTTLLILDGLDEGDSEAWDLIHLSIQQSCALLLLSRPHNVQSVRDKANTKIECLEFSDEHLKSFIARELPQEDVKESLKFMSQSPSIWEAARVPVNAQIICNMWTSSAKEELKTLKIMNLAWLYDQMVKYVWMRYTKKEDVDVKVGEKELVLSSLEVIAFESFKQGKVEIPESLVIEHSKTDSDAILRDAGFLLFVQEGQVFQFAHLTFHEYFASRHLEKMLNSNNDREQRNAKRFISEHKYRETSRVVFAFMIGIYCRDDDVEVSLECFKTIINILDDNSVEAIGWQHTFLKMRALDTFLTCCSNKNDLRLRDVQINEIVSKASDVVKEWAEIDWRFRDIDGMYYVIDHVWDKIIDDLGNMPNLHLEYSCFLEMIVNIKDIHLIYTFGNIDQIVKIAKCNPQVVRDMVPPNPNEIYPSDEDAWKSWTNWMCIYSKINEKCATEVVSRLLEAYKEFEHAICWHLIPPALALLEVFSDDKDIKQMILNLSQHSDSDVRSRTMQQISRHRFQPGSSAETLAWSFQKQAMQDSIVDVRRQAFNWSCRGNQIFSEDIDEMIEMLIKEINNVPCHFIAANVYLLLQITPHKESQCLPLLKELCLFEDKYIRYKATQAIWNIYNDSLLTKEKLYLFVCEICQDGHWDIKHDLLPLLSILEAECESISTNLVKVIEKESYRVDSKIWWMACACEEAKNVLSKNTMHEIQNKFFKKSYDRLEQVVILEHIYERNLLTLETIDVVAEMASIAIAFGNFHRQSYNYYGCKKVAILLLKNIVKEFRLSANAFRGLTERQYVGNNEEKKPSSVEKDWIYAFKIGPILSKQPLAHLLNYYFKFKGDYIVTAIADKLLLTPVYFTEISESEMKFTVIDGGSSVENRVFVEDGRRLIFLCKESLKNRHKIKHIF